MPSAAHHRRSAATSPMSSPEASLATGLNNEEGLAKAFRPLGILEWNSLFCIAQPGGPMILDRVEAKSGLKPEKLRATRHGMREYGSMSSPSVLFILDDMGKKSAEDGLKTTGEGLEWGVLDAFGPGLTIETVVLHSLSFPRRLKAYRACISFQ